MKKQITFNKSQARNQEHLETNMYFQTSLK